MPRIVLYGMRKLHPSMMGPLQRGAQEYPILFEGTCPAWLEDARYLPLVGMYAATVSRAELRRLDQEPSVRRIHHDRPVVAALDASRTMIGCAPERVGGASGRGVGVALLDSGCAPHPDLADALAGFIDLVRGEEEPYDDFGHGTHVAGVICGRGRLDPRFRGVAPEAHLLPIKVLNEEGIGRESTIILALEVALRHRRTHRLRIVNISLAGDGTSVPEDDPLVRAVENTWRQELVVVTTAGNEGRRGEGTIQSPGTSPVVITVGALTRRRKVARFSSRGNAYGPQKPDLVAPGTAIVAPLAEGSTLLARHPDQRVGEGYMRASGSSVAAAMVSGAVALLLARQPDLTPDEVKERLTGSAVDLGLAQNVQGQGLVCCARLVTGRSERGLLLGRRVLRLGDRGADVWYAQNRLNLLGYGDVGPASGLFDGRTGIAVACFQLHAGLPVTGVLDLATGRALEATGELGRRVLRLGATGTDVAELQRRLGLPASGSFDAETGERLASFHAEHGLAPCGVADRHTFYLLGDRKTRGVPFPGAGNPLRLRR